MVKLCFNICPFATRKLAQKWNKFAKVSLLFCQIRNKPSKICQRPVKYCQSGEISPHLVTLNWRASTRSEWVWFRQADWFQSWKKYWRIEQRWTYYHWEKEKTKNLKQQFVSKLFYLKDDLFFLFNKNEGCQILLAVLNNSPYSYKEHRGVEWRGTHEIHRN